MVPFMNQLTPDSFLQAAIAEARLGLAEAGIPKIMIGENRTFRGREAYVQSRGVIVDIVDDPECHNLMQAFVRARPELWNEDIGEEEGR
jgi:hypothetical protein